MDVGGRLYVVKSTSISGELEMPPPTDEFSMPSPKV
jgi:hypothetical protein